jgi:hypothetical protein
VDGGKKKGSDFGVTLLLALLLVAVGVALGLSVAYAAGNLSWTRFVTGEPETETATTEVVVEGVRELNELSSVQWTESVNVTRESGYENIPRFLSGERVLLVAVGEVRAGTDLDGIGSEDVRVAGESVTIDLPEPEILSTSLDEERTRIYDREQGLLNLRPNDTLVEEARLEAEREIETAARENGILAYAENGTEDGIRAFVQTLGFEEVRFE